MEPAMNRVGEETIEREIASATAIPALELLSRPTPAFDQTAVSKPAHSEPAVTQPQPRFAEPAKGVNSFAQGTTREGTPRRETQPGRDDEQASHPDNSPAIERPQLFPARVRTYEPFTALVPANTNPDSPSPTPVRTLRPVTSAIERFDQPSFAEQQHWPERNSGRLGLDGKDSAEHSAAVTQIQQRYSLRTSDGGLGPAHATQMDSAAANPESAAPTVNVVIGKVTVQANFPAVPAAMPMRVAASGGPRMTLERYLEHRRGRT
jgi:hypothetical protein